MNEARDIIRKLLPHLRTLSLDATRDELYEVKALISEAELFLAKPDPEPVAWRNANGKITADIDEAQDWSCAFDEVATLYAEQQDKKPVIGA